MRNFIFISLMVMLLGTGLLLAGEQAALASSQTEYEAKISEIAELYEDVKRSENTEEILNIMEEVKAIARELQEEYTHSCRANWEAAKALSNYNYFADLEEAEAVEILEEGKDYAERAVEADPENARAHFWQGAIIGELGQEEGIMSSLASVEPMQEALEKSIDLNPDFPPAHDAMAQLYSEAPGWPVSIGDDEKALEHRKKSVELASDNSQYLWRLYENYRELGREDEAQKTLEDILNLSEKNDYVREDVAAYKEKAEAALEDF